MGLKLRDALMALAGAGAMAVVFYAALPLSGQAPAAPRLPRVAGKPDLNGIWQAMNTANWDLEPHTAQAGAGDAARPGRAGAGEGSARVRRGRLGAGRPGRRRRRRDSVHARSAGKKREENQANWLTRDPEIKCYLPGVPRATYMPFPFQIFQSDKAVAIAYEYAGRLSQHLSEGSRSAAGRFVDGAVGRDAGKATRSSSTPTASRSELVRSRRQSPQRSAEGDRALHDDRSRSHSATKPRSKIPRRFTRPWKISMPLYRRVETGARLGAVQVRRVRRRVDVRPPAQGAGQVRAAASVAQFGELVIGIRSLVRLACRPLRLAGACARVTPAAKRAGARQERRQAVDVPRTPDGKPDLQGNWSNATQTPLERMGKQGADAHRRGSRGDRESRASRSPSSAMQPSDPNRPPPAKGGEERAAAARRADLHRAHLGRRRAARSAATTTSGSIPASSVLRDRRQAAQRDRDRSARRPRSGADAEARAAMAARARGRHARSSASSIIPSCAASPSAACCRSAPTPARRCCRTTSTTTTTRSCRPRIT